MEVQHRRCCGLAVHRDPVVACLLNADAPADQRQQCRPFATTTEGLAGLAAWWQAAGCSQVAMEATGVYGKPVFNVLEGQGAVLVANASHIKAVPGRKTDIQDAAGIADLLPQGLLRARCIPAPFQREWRDLTRTRTTLIDERTAVVNRLHKVLEDAHLQLSGVASDVLGVSGRAMIEAIVAGTTDPAALADLAKGRLRQKRAALEQALRGRVTDHPRRLLTAHLAPSDLRNQRITELRAAITERLRPFEAERTRLDTIPGVGRPTAEVLLAELGTDLAPFPTAAHAAAWAGMCPGNSQSAGKRKSGKTRRGSKYLRRALTEAAGAAVRAKHGYLATRYRRLVLRPGHKKAVFAVGHTILITVYHLLQRHEEYQDFDPTAADARRRARRQQHALAELQALGFDVALTPREQPAA